MLITIANKGQNVASTNYWETEHASAGLCYLSGNAGAWRLLVPEAAEMLLVEMRTGKKAIIEPSIAPSAAVGAWDVVFEDGSSSPFFLSLSPGQIDRGVKPGMCRLTVWTQAGGKVLDLPCEVVA